MASEGILDNRTDFGSASDQFRFTLTSRPKSGAVSARFAGGRIEVSCRRRLFFTGRIPKKWAFMPSSRRNAKLR
jgi:hypothetical protein